MKSNLVIRSVPALHLDLKPCIPTILEQKKSLSPSFRVKFDVDESPSLQDTKPTTDPKVDLESDIKIRIKEIDMDS